MKVHPGYLSYILYYTIYYILLYDATYKKEILGEGYAIGTCIVEGCKTGAYIRGSLIDLRNKRRVYNSDTRVRKEKTNATRVRKEKLQEKKDAYAKTGCCGPDGVVDGVANTKCIFSEIWDHIKGQLSEAEFYGLFEWDHNLQRYVKKGEISNISNKKKRRKEKRKCDLRCKCCHSIKGRRCGDGRHKK
jgi:hypothetical protein